MAYIYKITNDINNKVYIGKTERSIQARFQEHLRDARRSYCKDRPLYRAINKYGAEHFHIELIEETDTPEEREIYWIEQYRSFKNGYNATLGGEGKHYLDYDLIIATYFALDKNQKATAQKLQIDVTTIRKVLNNHNIEICTTAEHNRKNQGQIINQYDLQDNYIQSFATLTDAERSLNKPRGRQHIAEVCQGKRKTAYGYKWRYGQK